MNSMLLHATLAWHLILSAGCAAVLLPQAVAAQQAPPDLTQSQQVDRSLTYNLGATGLRGWIYSKPATYFDGLQGRTTAASRQILVTHVGAKSPADGVVQIDDVILGVGGERFQDDARKSFALAIQAAEQASNGGKLQLTCFRAGKITELQLQLEVLGDYSRTAPYDCLKSKRIFERASAVLANEPLEDNWHGSISALALLATGNADYLPKVQTFARRIAPATLDLRDSINGSTWELSYRNLFLCEYYLLTQDQQVRHAIDEITISLARGQGLYGTFGHGFAAPTADGKRHGSVPPYGPVNQAGLPANLAIVLGKICGVEDPDIDPAIERASQFFGYFVDKGAVPYGEHEPWPYHENNGKSAMAAMLFAMQPDRVEAARFFAKMATAGFRSRECGHTGQGFSYLWGALGANAGGPDAAAAFFAEASWHFDLVRRCDGSFTYDGGEQYGPGSTDDDTYYGKSGYYDLSPNATYVLSYALPLKQLLLTGRSANPKLQLSKNEVRAAIASGRFDLDRLGMSPEQLVAAFDDWSPIVRSWAAEELARRPDAKRRIPELIRMAEGANVHVAQAAVETLGYLNDKASLPVLVRLLQHDDRWLRFQAAKAIKRMGGTARSAVPDLLQAVVQTAEPLQPIGWRDPIQLTHGQLAEILFTGPLAATSHDSDSRLLYPAIRAVATNADGMARGKLRGFFENRLTVEDVQALAPDILAAVMMPCPADTMFSNEIRMGGFQALTKFHFEEGIQAGVQLAKTQGGHGSESRTGEIMAVIMSYGSAARSAVPGLRQLIAQFDAEVAEERFPGGELNQRRVDAVKEAIRVIEAATTQPELRRIVTAAGKK